VVALAALEQELITISAAAGAGFGKPGWILDWDAEHLMRMQIRPKRMATSLVLDGNPGPATAPGC